MSESPFSFLRWWWRENVSDTMYPAALQLSWKLITLVWAGVVAYGTYTMPSRTPVAIDVLLYGIAAVGVLAFLFIRLGWD